MACLLPLPYDIQFEIDTMVTSMKMKEVIHQLNEICDEFRQQIKNDAEEKSNTYWMWDQDEQDLLSPEQISDWEDMSDGEMDHDLYMSKWEDNGYRFFMCLNAVMTNDPENLKFTSLPLP
jgi:hypothetical protein